MMRVIGPDNKPSKVTLMVRCKSSSWSATFLNRAFVTGGDHHRRSRCRPDMTEGAAIVKESFDSTHWNRSKGGGDIKNKERSCRGQQQEQWINFISWIQNHHSRTCAYYPHNKQDHIIAKMGYGWEISVAIVKPQTCLVNLRLPAFQTPRYQSPTSNSRSKETDQHLSHKIQHLADPQQPC